MSPPSATNEITLFDFEGKPVAYIAVAQENTIYLWQGKPVAHLQKDSSVAKLYNFEGEHLGWFEDGFIFGHGGNVVGFAKGVLDVLTFIEPVKGAKLSKPAQRAEKPPELMPFSSGKWASKTLQSFLEGPPDPPEVLLTAGYPVR